MPTFYDSKGESYVLNQQIGRGGEGTVFFCPNDSALVAKIYHEPITEEKAEKLRWMADNKNEQLLKVAAWIVDTLHDENNVTVGFLMPNVKAKEIHELYSLKSRRVHFPDATWKFLIHTATNVARAFYNLHKNNHVMGDVNHGNCVVLRDGTVKLIDCDSYSISKGDFRYRCEVGVATHLAPELQGVDLGEVERENKHDNFGLAVIIFQLLFLGRHPFSGNYLGDEDKSLEDCIRELRFAYGSDAQLRMVKQPPGTLSLSKISPRLAMMFERAFLTDDRPEPREWIEALEDLSESLKQCSLHIGHFYFQDLTSCPWCELESQTGLMLFPFINANRTADDGEFNIFTVETLVASLAVPGNLPVKLTKSATLNPLPSPEAETARRENLSRFITLAVVQFAVVVFLTAIAGAGVGFFIGALLMAGFIISLNNAGKNSKIDLEVRLESARQDWQRLESEWSTLKTAPNFNDDLALVRSKINEHHQLQQQTREQVKLLRGEVYHSKLESFLASFKIGEAKIADDELRRLKSFGVRSAADVNAKRLQALPNINYKVIDKLVNWRENLERKFVHNPNTEIPEADQKRLTSSFTEKRGRIEREIEGLLVTLRSNSTTIRQRQQFLSTRAEDAAKKLLQSESDMAAAGNTTVPIIVLILITTIIPMFGSAMSGSQKEQSNYPYNSGNSEPIVRVKSATPSSIYKNDNSNKALNVYGYTVPDSLTDEQIKNLNDIDKASGAEQLLDRAKANVELQNFKKAEQQLQLALKLEPENIEILNELGKVLYEQKKYKDSLVYLNRSLLIEPNFAETKFAVGASYLKMNYYEDARRIFTDLIDRNPRSFEANFNLGKACRGSGEYLSAVTAFRTATEIEPDNADAHYEYAISLNKVGTRGDVLEEYQKLLIINPKTAEKLRKDLGLKNVPKYKINVAEE